MSPASHPPPPVRSMGAAREMLFPAALTDPATKPSRLTRVIAAAAAAAVAAVVAVVAAAAAAVAAAAVAAAVAVAAAAAAAAALAAATNPSLLTRFAGLTSSGATCARGRERGAARGASSPSSSLSMTRRSRS